MRSSVAYDIAEILYNTSDLDAEIVVHLQPGGDVELCVRPAKSTDQRALLVAVCRLATEYGLEVRLSSPADHAHAPTLRLGRWGSERVRSVA